MKPEVSTMSFEVIGIRVHIRISETDTISTVLPHQPHGIDHLTIGQIKEAAIRQALKPRQD